MNQWKKFGAFNLAEISVEFNTQIDESIETEYNVEITYINDDTPGIYDGQYKDCRHGYGRSLKKTTDFGDIIFEGFYQNDLLIFGRQF